MPFNSDSWQNSNSRFSAKCFFLFRTSQQRKQERKKEEDRQEKEKGTKEKVEEIERRENGKDAEREIERGG